MKEQTLIELGKLITKVESHSSDIRVLYDIINKLDSRIVQLEQVIKNMAK